MKNILENILENILQKIYLSKIKFGFLVRLIWKMTPPRPLMYLLLIERYKKVSEKNLKKNWERFKNGYIHYTESIKLFTK